MKAIVVGAGLAGLTAAYRLRQAGWDVVVLEKANAVGGRTVTFEKNGYLLEKGANQMITGYTSYIRLAEEVGLGDELVPTGNGLMLMRNGRTYSIDGTQPLRTLFTRALSLRSKLLMLRTIKDYLALKPRIDVHDVSNSWQADTENCKEYAARRLNMEIFNVLIDPLIRTYTINRAENVSVLEWFSGLSNLVGNRLLALRGGVNRLPALLASKLDVRLSAQVEEVRTTVSGVEVTFIDSDGQHTLQADGCIVATRLSEAKGMIPELADAMRPLASKLKYNRAVVVYLGYTRRTNTDALGVLVPTIEHPQVGLVWLDHNKLKGTAPPGHSLITCYLEEGGLDEIQPGTDKQFIAIADAFVTKLFPELEGSREMEEVTRWNEAIANPAPGVYRAVYEMKQRLSAAFPIQLAGDYFTCTGQNSAVHWGQRAAENLVAHVGRRNASSLDMIARSV